MVMFKTSIKYSIACALFLLILLFLSRSLGLNPLMDLSQLIFDALIFTLFTIFAIREFKIYQNGGNLHFWQGMTIGFFVYLPSILVFTIGFFVLFTINDSLLEEYKVEAMQFLELKKEEYINQFGQEQYEAQILAIENIALLGLTTTTAIKKLIAGFFVSPMISIILRKKPIT